MKLSKTYKEANVVVIMWNDRGTMRTLLGLKKGGPTKGKWTPPGGKYEESDPSRELGAQREVKQETQKDVSPATLRRVGKIMGYGSREAEEPSWVVDVYVTLAHDGHYIFNPEEYERMEWFPADDLPYHLMMPTDEEWMPRAMQFKRFLTVRAYPEQS